jgi:hypothetical protein
MNEFKKRSRLKCKMPGQCLWRLAIFYCRLFIKKDKKQNKLCIKKMRVLILLIYYFAKKKHRGKGSIA